MKRFQFTASTALALLFLAPAPGLAADVILLPGTGPGDGGGAAPAPRQAQQDAVVGGASGGGGRATRGRLATSGAGLGTVDDLLAVGALTRSQAAAFRASIRRIAHAQAAGRSEDAWRARNTFRTMVDRFVRNGVLAPGTAQRLVEAV